MDGTMVESLIIATNGWALTTFGTSQAKLERND